MSEGDNLAGDNKLVITQHNGYDDDDEDYEESEVSTPSRRAPATETKKKKGGKGRCRIDIKYVVNKSRRQVTFSRRKRGLMKKAFELTTLTGTQGLVLIASETGHVYTFATPKLQPMVTLREGKELIQSCLNAPDVLTDSLPPLGHDQNNTNNHHHQNNHHDPHHHNAPQSPSLPPLSPSARDEGIKAEPHGSPSAPSSPSSAYHSGEGHHFPYPYLPAPVQHPLSGDHGNNNHVDHDNDHEHHHHHHHHHHEHDDGMGLYGGPLPPHLQYNGLYAPQQHPQHQQQMQHYPEDYVHHGYGHHGEGSR